MKKASIAVALVLVFGLFAAAFSLTPAIAQYGAGPSSTPSAGTPTSDNSTSAASGNATTAGNTTTSSATSTNATSTNATGTNATSTQGSTFSAKGSIATLIFDTGTTVTNNTNETGTSSTNTTNATSTSNATSSNMTSLGNTTTAGNATSNTTLSQTIVGGDNSTSTAGNATEGNMETSSNMTSLGNTTTAGNATSNATSTASLEQPYILSGQWSLDVQGGTVSDFKANFTMVHIDGTMRHTHEVSNFQMANGSTVQLEQNGTTIIFGTADVSKKWTGVDAVITIDKLNVASISFASEDTDDHFHGQPIYGVVDSLTDENGNEMIQTAGGTTTSGGNVTSNTTQSGQGALNQTSNTINNATQGVQDFLNGTG